MDKIKQLESLLKKVEGHLMDTREINFKIKDENSRIYQDGIGKLVNIQKSDLEQAVTTLSDAIQLTQTIPAKPQHEQNVLSD